MEKVTELFTLTIAKKLEFEAVESQRKELGKKLLDCPDYNDLLAKEKELSAEYADLRTKSEKACEENRINEKVVTENGSVTPSMKKTFSVVDQKAFTDYLEKKNELEKVFKLELSASNFSAYVNEKDSEGETVDGVEVGEKYAITVSSKK